MTTILLVTPKTDYPPVGVLYIADALQKAEFGVRVVDCDIPDTGLIHLVDQLRPIFVGFSAHIYPSLTSIAAKSKLIATTSTVPIVWGGNYPTCLPEQCISHPYVDYIVTGDGEEAVVKLARDIVSGSNLRDRIRNGGAVKKLDRYTPSWKHVDLDRYLFPASHSVRGNSERGDTDRIFYYLMTSRGCPYNCAFCYNSHTPKQPWRCHSYDWIKNQVLFLKKELDIDGVGFWDDFFLGNRRRAERVVAFLHSQGIGFLCEARVADLNDETMSWLKESGCLQVFVGAESGSSDVLKRINKSIEVEDIIYAADLAHCHDLPVRFSFIYGFPGETCDEMMETKKLIKLLNKMPNVSISGPKLYTPYPKTALYKLALHHGFKAPETPDGWAKINRASNLRYLPWLEKELERSRKNLSDLFDFEKGG